MKKFSEYSELELGSLTADQVHHLIQLECAEKGIKILQRPARPASLESIQDASYFEIEGTGIKSENESLIRHLANKLKTFRGELHDTDWNSKVGYDFKYLNPEATHLRFDVREVKCFKKSTIDSYSPVVLNYIENKKHYDAALEEFVESQNQFDLVRVEITTAWQSARATYQKINDLKERWEMYIHVANGNQTIAKRFFDNAFPGGFDLIKNEFPWSIEDENGTETAHAN